MSIKRLEAKIVILTGTDRGFGRATAVAFAREGAVVVGLDIAKPVSATLEVNPTAIADLKETGAAKSPLGLTWLP